MPKAYYNEFDPKAAAWLRELIHDHILTPGDVDERSICDVQPSDLDGYTQCHFFAGIGGWDFALHLAGWPEDRPVWTGSCPCQPFSAAGKRKGQADVRHLWPEFYRLIRECKPATVFGEQVASSEVVGTELEAAFLVAVQAGKLARANKLAKRLAASRSFHYYQRWLDGILADLEASGYTFRAEVLGAHSVGAPHIRQRLYWLADAERNGGRQHEPLGGPQGRDADGSVGEGSDRLDNPIVARLERHSGHGDDGGQPGRLDADSLGSVAATGGAGFWSDFRIVYCRDGKYRRISSQPEVFPLAHGLPGRVGLLRGAGNAILPEVAEAFIRAYLEVTN